MLVIARVQLLDEQLKLSKAEQDDLAKKIAYESITDDFNTRYDEFHALFNVKTGKSTISKEIPQKQRAYYTDLKHYESFVHTLIPTPVTCQEMYKKRISDAIHLALKHPDCGNHDTLLDAGLMLRYAKYWGFYKSQYKGPMNFLDWKNTFQEDEYEELEGPFPDVINVKVVNADYGGEPDYSKPPTHIVVFNVEYDTEDY